MKLFDLKTTDLEFAERFEAFANSEVVNEPGVELDEKTRNMAVIASLLGCQGIEAFKVVAEEALSTEALTPVELKEVVYQAVAYLGMGKVYPFISASNEVLTKLGVALPLEGQATTTMEDRREGGTQCQMNIFGPGMKDYWKAGHMNRWLAANCFGDYYTRNGLDLKQREMITFCYLMSQGGCESQLTAHTFGNLALGNGKEFLMSVIAQCVPYIGYPRSLNAIAVVNKATEQK